MKPTIGIPLGMLTGLMIYTFIMVDRSQLSWPWFAGCIIMMSASFSLKGIIDSWANSARNNSEPEPDNK